MSIKHTQYKERERDNERKFEGRSYTKMSMASHKRNPFQNTWVDNYQVYIDLIIIKSQLQRSQVKTRLRMCTCYQFNGEPE